jgi:hypothetical protein
VDSIIKIEDPRTGAPTLLQLARVSDRIKKENVIKILLEPETPAGIGEKLKELNPNLELIPLPEGLTDREARDLPSLFDLYVTRLTSR